MKETYCKVCMMGVKEVWPAEQTWTMNPVPQVMVGWCTNCLGIIRVVGYEDSPASAFGEDG